MKISFIGAPLLKNKSYACSGRKATSKEIIEKEDWYNFKVMNKIYTSYQRFWSVTLSQNPDYPIRSNGLFTTEVFRCQRKKSVLPPQKLHYLPPSYFQTNQLVSPPVFWHLLWQTDNLTYKLACLLHFFSILFTRWQLQMRNRARRARKWMCPIDKQASPVRRAAPAKASKTSFLTVLTTKPTHAASWSRRKTQIPS